MKTFSLNTGEGATTTLVDLRLPSGNPTVKVLASVNGVEQEVTGTVVPGKGVYVSLPGPLVTAANRLIEVKIQLTNEGQTSTVASGKVFVQASPASVPAGSDIDLSGIEARLESLETNTPTIDLSSIEERLLPDDGSKDMLLLRAAPNEPGIGKWVAPSNASKYRGTWGPDEPVALYDFNTGLITPFVPVYEGAATSANTFQGVGPTPNNVGGTAPVYANSLFLSPAGTNGSTTIANGVEVDLSSVLGDKNATRIKFFDSLTRLSSASGFSGEVVTNGGVVRYATPFSDVAQTASRPWRENTVAIPGATTLRVRVRHTGTTSSGNTNRYYVAGLRIYANANPYMFGDTVDYAGKLYRSEVNNNSSTPGTNAEWTAIP